MNNTIFIIIYIYGLIADTVGETLKDEYSIDVTIISKVSDT